MRLAPLLAASLLVTDLATAQGVRGRTVASDSATVPGAIVTLIDEEGTPVSRALAGEDGRFAIGAPKPGRYRLQVLRLGFRPTVTELFPLAAGEVLARSVVLTGLPVSLAAVHVTADQQCEVSPRAGDALAVWEEGRKALMASQLTRMTRGYQMDVRLFIARRGANAARSDTVKREELRASTLRPFETLPPERLAADGYLVRGARGITFYAPDEGVLLSESFAGTHCLRLLPDSAGPAVVRLAFSPVPGRSQPDIAGELVIDRASAELRRLDFNYVNLPAADAVGSPRGEIRFRRLPEGSWIIEHWALRLPYTEIQPGPAGPAIGMARGGIPVFRPADPVVRIGQQTTGGTVTRVAVGDSTVWQPR